MFYINHCISGVLFLTYNVAFSHLALSFCKFCKVGQNPLDKPGQRSCRNEEEPIHSLAHTFKPTLFISTLPPVLSTLCVRVCVSWPCSVSGWFTHTPHPKPELVLPVTSHQRVIQCPDNGLDQFEWSRKRGLTKWRGEGALCFDVKSFSFLSVLGQLHCHHSRVTWIENTEPA